MITAKERVQRALRKYNLAEHKTDSLLLRLVKSPYTLAVVFAVASLVLWMSLR